MPHSAKFDPGLAFLAAYADAPRSWKRDHDAALQCRDLEDTLAVGNWLFGALSRIDDGWHGEVFEGRIPYDPEEEAQIRSFYRGWLKPCEQMLTKIAEFEAQGFEVSGASEFRRNCSEVKGILTPDSQFFSSDALVELRDQAIDSHRAGLTTDFHEHGAG
jgi:hypothetical protein